MSSQEKDELPEDCIPDLPENKDAREFLAHAPSKGLWMPLGKEVKVMKCEFKIVSAQSSSNKCKNYLLKIYSRCINFLNTI